jgi:hypothetical protein
MFAYCENNPVTNYDPTGRFRVNFQQKELEGGVAGTGAAIGVGYIFIQLLATTQEAVEELIEGLQQIQISISPPTGAYTVYFLCAAGDSSKTIIYVGRVKTDNFSSRMSYHEKMGREYVDSISNLGYESCRAIEQAGMMYYHTINRDSALNNQIRGISPTNKKGHIYFALMQEMINRNLYPENSLLPLSYWENLTENEFLNITP